MQKLLITLFVLFGLALSVDVQVGANTTVSANTRTTIAIFTGLIPTGISMDITTNADAQVSLNLINSITTTLPTGYSNNTLTFGANLLAGFVLSVYPSSAFVSANFTTGATIGNSLQTAAVARGNVLGLLYTNTSFSTSTYTDIDVSYSVPLGVQVDLPLPGIYIFATASASARIPSVYNTAKRLVANQLRRLWFQSELLISVVASTNSSVTVTKNSANVRAEPPSVWVSAGVWFSINSQNDNVIANISYTFTEAKWATLNAARLAIGYFNTTVNSAGAWVFQPTTVDVNARTVTTATTHFSDWAVYQDNSTSTSATSAGATSAASVASSAGVASSGTAATSRAATSANSDKSAGSVVGIAAATFLAALLF